MGKQDVLVDRDCLPEVYGRVLEAKSLLASGEAASASEAAKRAGISRSAYYKYKDAVREYRPEREDANVTLRTALLDSPGILSGVMNHLYQAGANILSLNQEVPVDGVADVTITVYLDAETDRLARILEEIRTLKGVRSLEQIHRQG
ncbi:MAG: ACT domain-containing protein [Clostridiales bacterium]|nr:ACT domain-containing protein [Clostridiales bacterium]